MTLCLRCFVTCFQLIQKAKKYLIHFTVIVRPERFRRVNETIFCCTAQVFLRMSDQPFYNVQCELHVALETKDAV